MFLFELIWRLLADSVGLSWECSYSNVRVEGFPFVYEFEKVTFLSLHELNKINENNVINMKVFDEIMNHERELN